MKARQLTGRCRNGAERDRGTVYHAVGEVQRPFGRALCGARPGLRSGGWSDQAGECVTCPRCLRKLSRQADEALQAGIAKAKVDEAAAFARLRRQA